MSFQEMEMKTEIEIIEDWKPSDVPASPLFNGQNKLTRSDLNESENPNDDISIGSVFTLNVEDYDNLTKTAEDIPNISIDHEEKIHIKDEIKQEIKSEPLDKIEGVHDGSNDYVIKRASDMPNICFDHEDNISIKKEIKHEIKNEPLDKVHDGSNGDVIKRASDMSNICFDHEDNFPIKKEIKQRICTWCKTPVASFEKYQNHIDENHLEILIKKCYFCEFESRQRLKVHNHIFAKHSLKPILPSHFCEYCLEFRATSSDVINFHIEKCPAKLIMGHEKDDDDSNFRILKDKSSPLKIVLSKEQQQLADSGGGGIRPQHDEIVFNCHLCAYKTEDKVDFGSHLMQHFDNKCVICNNIFMTAELLDQHITEQHGSFVQVIKHEEIDSSDHLATDNAGLRNVVEEKLTEESPRKPSRRFMSYDLKRHIESVHKFY